jgi:cytochrome P450
VSEATELDQSGGAATTLTLTTYQELWDGFRQRDLRQGLYTAGGVVMKDTLLDLHGPAHQLRRRVENRLFRRGTFRSWEAELVPQIIREAFDPVLAAGAADLVVLGTRATMNLTARIAGIDRQTGTVEETDALQEFAHKFSEGATLAHTTRDPEIVRGEVREALARFDAMFFEPSYELRLALVADPAVDVEDQPKDVLTALIRHQEELGLERDDMLREVAFYLQAGSHSTADAFTHSVDEILRWAAEHPERAGELDDDLFVQRCVHEVLRLHPASPEALREAVVDVTLRDGRVVKQGNFVRMDIRAANTDTSVFGEDAARFDPDRVAPSGVQPWGHTFGAGMHACIGMELDGGTVPKGSDSERVLGTVTLMVRELLRHGVTHNPEAPPVKELGSSRDHFSSYPVLLGAQRS